MTDVTTCTLAALLHERARTFKDSEAILAPGHTPASYAQLLAQVEDIAADLRACLPSGLHASCDPFSSELPVVLCQPDKEIQHELAVGCVWVDAVLQRAKLDGTRL